jgi:hypothetical protein
LSDQGNEQIPLAMARDLYDRASLVWV